MSRELVARPRSVSQRECLFSREWDRTRKEIGRKWKREREGAES